MMNKTFIKGRTWLKAASHVDLAGNWTACHCAIICDHLLSFICVFAVSKAADDYRAAPRHRRGRDGRETASAAGRGSAADQGTRQYISEMSRDSRRSETRFGSSCSQAAGRSG